MTGSRVEQKAATRDRIAAAATALFIERGFDQVTVAVVAMAAGVSKVTVFSHFLRKEDLAIDRMPEAVDLVTSAVRGRALGETPVAALERLATDLADRRHVFSGLRPSADPFIRMVRDSPALLTRAQELLGDLERTLAELLREAGTDGARAALLAAVVLAAYRVIYSGSAARVLAGEDPDEIAEAHRRALTSAFRDLRTFEAQGSGG